MFGSIGLPEILFILLIALLIFGPRRLPEISRNIGKALGSFQRSAADLKRSLDTEVTLDKVRPSPPSTPKQGRAVRAEEPAQSTGAPPEGPEQSPATASEKPAAETEDPPEPAATADGPSN